MELLIVLGLCFGAYELLGVFQGCFHYNEHALPYQPQQYNNINNSSRDTKENNTDNENDNENKSDDYHCEKKQLEKSEIRRKLQERRKLTAATIHHQLRQHQHQEQQQEEREYEDDEEDEEEEEDDNEIEEEDEETHKSGPCSCYSTVTEDDFDDDTRTILRNSSVCRTKASRKPINKYSLSKSLMSLNRDDSSFLFNYLDDVNNNASKFSKFKSEIEISETSFSNRSNRYSSRRNSNNERRQKRRVSRDTFETIDSCYEKHNETNECNASVNLDTNNKKKIFFISAAS